MSLASWTIWAAWTLVVVVLISSHEMWRDELQAWAIVRDSPSLLDLLGNLRYEGHPPGWYLPLWAVSKVTRSPGASALVTAVFGSGATWLVLRYLPYTMLVRVLLVAGYFPLYEFGTISRSYGLLYLATLAFLAVADRRSGWSVGLVALLFLMAGTLATALPLVAALAVGHWMRRRDLNVWRALAVCTALCVAGGLVVFHSLAPPDGRVVDVQLPSSDALQQVLRAPTQISVPVPEFVLSFWGQFLTARLEGLEWVLGVVIAVGFGFLLRRSPAAVMVWILSIGGLLIPVAAMQLPWGAPRQISVLWVSALASAWIAGSDAVARREVSDFRPSLAARILAAAALVLAVVAAGWAGFVEVREPFAGGEGAAEWIEDQASGSPVTILCATYGYLCGTVAIRLDEPAYMQAGEAPSTFFTWRRNPPRHRTGPELVAEARAVRELTGNEVMVVATASDAPAGCEDGWISRPTIVAGEQMVVCRADQLTIR